MKLEQIRWENEESGWKEIKSEFDSSSKPQLVIVFGHPDLIQNSERYNELKIRYPESNIIGGTTAGNIQDINISDDDIIATAVYLEKSKVKVISKQISDTDKFSSIAAEMITSLASPDLKHVFVLADGIHFNGSELASGVNVSDEIAVTGGLVGDQGKFERTLIIADAPAKENCLLTVGFYGDDLHVGHGCFAGWGEFGADRLITKSEGNVVYEIDNQPALTLYKKYLGEYASELPASGLRFPLSIRQEEKGKRIIRTLLGVDEENQSLTFAGDVPEGSITLLMKGDVDELITSASEAAEQASYSEDKRGLAIIISCVGRKLFMGQMTDEELETVQDVLGKNTWMTGFYSYGELAPFSKTSLTCQLHNQTMTLMTIYEK